ncbi:MAG: hypothetical protein AB1790_06455 [Pseudomonadota bacterium]
MLYADKLDVPQSDDYAFDWFLHAAELDNKRAMFNVALALGTGMS